MSRVSSKNTNKKRISSMVTSMSRNKRRSMIRSRSRKNIKSRSRSRRSSMVDEDRLAGGNNCIGPGSRSSRPPHLRSAMTCALYRWFNFSPSSHIPFLRLSLTNLRRNATKASAVKYQDISRLWQTIHRSLLCKGKSLQNNLIGGPGPQIQLGTNRSLPQAMVQSYQAGRPGVSEPAECSLVALYR